MFSVYKSLAFARLLFLFDYLASNKKLPENVLLQCLHLSAKKLMQVAGVVILYHPDDDVLQNIQSYLPHLIKLYVADNTESNISSAATELQADEKIKVSYDGKNNGIAKRLNEAAGWAIENGFDWLLTMDQDSRFDENNLQAYLQCADAFVDKENTAMFGVEYEKKSSSTLCESKPVVQLITSGSLVNLMLYKQLDGFNEALFIDEVDLEYCYRAITKGFTIIKFTNIFLVHHLGSVSYHKSLKNLAITPRVLHSPVRLYYMVRNYLYVHKKYGNRFAENDKCRRQALLNRIKNNLLYGKQRVKTLRYIMKAIIDFKKSKFGKKVF